MHEHHDPPIVGFHELPDSGPVAADLPDLRRVRYGLDAILRLHMAQEEELYSSVGGERSGELTAMAA